MTLYSVHNFFWSREIPFMGFPCDPVLCFNASDVYPTFSTCAINTVVITSLLKMQWMWSSHVMVPMVGSERVNCSVTCYIIS